MSTKMYRTEVALSAASGKLLCEDFSSVHELITDLAGWPVMTHHLANGPLWAAVAQKIIVQVPWIAHAIKNLPDFDTSTREVAKEQVGRYVDRIVALQGPFVVLELGEAMEPLPLLAGLEHLVGPQ